MYLETLRSRIDAHAKDTTVHVTADEKSLWNSLASLFELVDIGTEESPLKAIRAKYGLFSDSFLSARGSDPEAGQGGIGGLDIDAMWDALAESGTQKINASHIPLLQQLSGTLTNAQLANSSLSVAGVSVPLGGAVSTEQIASALTEAGYKLTDTVTTLASLGITATAAELNFVDGVTSNIQTQLNAKANASALTAYALKDGSNASGTWAIDISGTAADASALGGIYSADYMSHFRQSGVDIDTYATRSPKIIEVSEIVGTKPLSTQWLQVMQWGSNDPAYGFQMANLYSTQGNLYFRQKAAGTWGGWKTLLDTANYASMLDTRYLLKSTYTASDILAKLKTVDGSGSGLDADLLDGYQATSFNLATNLGACQDYGAYVIGLMQITDYTIAGNMANGTLIFIRQNGNNPAQKIIYSLSTRYGSTNVRFGYLTLSTNIYVLPCTFTYNGKKWAGFQVSSPSSYSSGVVCVRDGLRLGERSTPFLLKYKVSNTGAVINSEVNSSVVINGADIIESGVSSNAFSGNASSATKLATARLLWGRSFDGSGDIRGNIIVGDAIIHGSVTSNNTRFISSDNASNIYFSVGGLVDLVAEPSCLRRGASNTSETLGTSTYRWANVYAVNGDYSGNLAVSGWINGGLNISIFGSNSDNSDTTRFLTYGHRVEFGGPGYAHVNYYLRPRYGANGVTHADLFIQNASAAASPVFSTTHYFDHNGNAYHWGNLGLGTTSFNFKLNVAGTGYFSGLLRLDSGVQIGSTSDIGWYLNSGRIVAGQSVARGVNVGSLLVSGAWADYTKVPTNGIYSKGDIYSMGAISCRGADSQAADASSGIDSNALWNVLGAVGTEKINASHLPDCSKTLTCSTTAGTAAKVVTCTGFQLTTGAAVTVRFTSGNSAASPTLNVNGTGAKGIRVYRGTSLVTPFANWNANVTVELTYNGTYWVITGNPVVYSLNAASASDSSGTYYRTARIFADGWKEYAFVTNASGNDRTLAMPYAFSSVNSMGVVVTLFGTAPGAGNVKSKSTSSVTVDFSTSTASTSKRGTVLCFGY